ncbi:Uncharacterized conserved protein YutE, UPF0331/DUF86 family [Clostridium gasigenes]|uniref:Uncharacterized conserved protein YutE, UPF0331/DUF86 family n=1 Tax=Clostridium gasigenes TaxID=94869 RepID=A0A1H0QD61_9CLOT|nr:Uncharacterized conserved protein YutE, UPF0331/DUF86 family [Clostridium gasigenes]
MDFEEKLDEAIKLLQDFNPVIIYLFGSASRGELRNESDIDISFLSDDDIDEYICFMKAQELASIFNRDVDLIDMKKASTVFKAQIIGTAKKIFCNDENKRMYFEMRSFKEYALLNEERAEILKDIIFNKISSIERCINRIEEVYCGNPESLEDYTKQYSIILNIQRACECSIDLAMHIVSEKKLGIPQNSRDGFEVLESNGVVEKKLSNKMKSMVGFRNIAVHNYENVNMKVVQMIIEKHLGDFAEYIYAINKFASK